MLDSVLDFGMGEIRETKRNFGRSSEDICKEYIVTGGGVGWTVPRVDDLGRSRYGCQLRVQLRNRAKKKLGKIGEIQRAGLGSPRVERGRGRGELLGGQRRRAVRMTCFRPRGVSYRL